MAQRNEENLELWGPLGVKHKPTLLTTVESASFTVHSSVHTEDNEL